MTATLTVRMPTLVQEASGSCLSAKLEGPSFSQVLYFRVKGCSLSVDGTPFIAAALPLAMSRGWNLQVEGPVSALLQQSIPQIQSVFKLWVPGFEKIEWQAPTLQTRSRPSASGTFFSGGVDSYYTYLKHQKSIASLIFVTGFDIPLHKTELAQRVSASIRQTAQALDVNLIEVTTNLREFCDQFVSWRMYHGAALASVAHLVGQAVGTVYLAATHTYADLFACGTHPLLDPLWSSETVNIVHDGCEATRFQKVARLAQSDIALKTLRVCYRNRASELNCGRCEKCLRTMISLYSLNVLDRCETFANTLDIRQIARLRLGGNPRILMYVQENLTALKERHDSKHVVQAVQRSMRRPGLLRQLNRQAKPLFRRSTYLKWFGQAPSKQS